METFSALPEDYAVKSIAVAPFDEKKAGSIEFDTYRSKLEARLREQGLTVTSLDDMPDYVAYFGYAIDDGRDVQTSYSIPQYGVTGYSSSTTYGTVNTYGNQATYSGTTYNEPEYGVTGYSQGVRTDRVYTRSVAIKFYDVEAKKEVWSVQSVSSGSCGLMRPIMTPMLDSIFREFPSTQGRVDIPFDGDC